MTMGARGVLLLTGCLAVAAGAAERPLLGAIRWDAWHVPTAPPEQGLAGGPVRAMERSLGPQRYHWRLPFFGEVLGPDTVRIPGYSQAIVDQEIAFAQAGGLDYWAFLLYDQTSPMSQGLALYRSSVRRQDVRFCAIASPPPFGHAPAFDAGTRRRVEHPVPWEKNQQPGVGLDRYYETPTPVELADHLADALTWAAADPSRCPAQAVLTYAWNEHDEGGWLCPTRGADGRPDTSRLDAIAAMRRAWTPPAGR